MTQRRWTVLAGAGLLALALGLRLHGLGWGLPEVYEEAYPFKKSWEMWGWGSGPLDFNPHFFNYPSLYFYLQFLGQGVLFLLLKLRGVIESSLDYRLLYTLDKTPFYLLGRGMTALFGAGTVLVTAAIGRRVGGQAVAVMAGLLVAVNAFHIEKSQVVEVDVPMTCLAMLCCLFALRILDGGRRRDYLLAALFGGLATSTKYNGALLALPILFAHLLSVGRRTPAPVDRTARRRGERQAPTIDTDAQAWASLGLAALVFVASFLLTSPYVLLDSTNFWIGFNYERLHMKIGHFGLDDTPTIQWYLRVMTRSLLGWPLAVASGAGLIVFGIAQHRKWAIVLAVFPLVYLTLISMFSMKAERYILPLLPLAAVFASTLVIQIVDRLRNAATALRALIAVVATAGLAAPSVFAYVRDLDRLRPDTRTLSREWIEEQMPAGSFVVTESYGPEPMSVIDLANLDPEVRDRLVEKMPDAKVYAVFQMPMYQVRPENTSMFYELSLYRDAADLIITSSSVSSRYRKKPEEFPAQNAFYDSLAAGWKVLRAFGPEDGTGPRITIYGNPHLAAPFAKRTPVAPPALPVVADQLPGSFASGFQRLAFLYESYGFQAAAAQIYQMGLRYPDQPFEARKTLGVGAVRASLRAGRATQALAVLEQLENAAANRSEAAFWHAVRSQITAPAPAAADSARANDSGRGGTPAPRPPE